MSSKRTQNAANVRVQLDDRLLEARTALALLESELIRRFNVNEISQLNWALVSDTSILVAKLNELVDQHIPKAS